MVGLEITPQGAVLRVRLNRPERHNAFDAELIAALAAAFAGPAADPAVRAVVLSGAGPSLCAGADARWMRAAADYTQAENEADARALSDMLAAIDRCPAPVIAVAHGSVFGGGVGLLAAADMVVATPDMRACLSEVKLGLVPATIGPFVLRAIGARAARRWFLTAEVFGAADALAMGLVHAVASDLDAAHAQAEAWIAALLGNAPGAVADAKRLIADLHAAPVTDDLRAETARRIAARRASPEGREGLGAFLGKRRPNWIPDA
jgi:methylglutaconyl-CoA hydratase